MKKTIHFPSPDERDLDIFAGFTIRIQNLHQLKLANKFEGARQETTQRNSA